jgi:hypothetical protein
LNNATSSVPPRTSAQVPGTEAAETSPVSILLTRHQTALMDEIAAAIRRQTGTVISRSAMLRAIAAAVLPYYPEWLDCQSTVEIQQRIAIRLGRGNK